ncbi:hypothetical protein BSL78_12267 [Apostichopus japonicus]|uniref:Uncharacterized protein n=1 Tax=Stichopus japonicus TaxID=307972 RepID=A0A2G8KS83_STIJA|nr:hypothetical protein BSL78_12267 [Apostichopus japonicus]
MWRGGSIIRPPRFATAASVSPSLDGTDVGVTQVTNLGATGTVENMDATVQECISEKVI